MRKLLSIAVLSVMTLVAIAGPAAACAALLAPNGTINLLRTATLAAYHEGIEHYITAFEFQGGGAKFGSIVPLPGVPTDVKRGGDWTLQRLQQEVQPQVAQEAEFATAAGASVADARVLLETKVDALDITVLEGGGDDVGLWAKQNGFLLPPDAPEILDFYADRSPIFMAVSFNVARAQARGRSVGDSIPVHVTIPTPNPWVPLRILTLGAEPDAVIEADVFLLTDSRPALLPAPRDDGFVLDRSFVAGDLLMRDLRSDRGMKWLPTDGMHVTYLKIDAPAATLDHDLAIDATGLSAPSFVAAGLAEPAIPFVVPEEARNWWLAAIAMGLASIGLVARMRQAA